MKNVRLLSRLLFYLARIMAIVVLLVFVYALVVLLLSYNSSASSIPIRIFDNGTFEILFPFTNKPFLLGDYNAAYLVPNLLIVAFYGLFLWLLGSVFHAFKQEKLFTTKGVHQLSRFYITNLMVPLLFLFFALLGQEITDMVRIIFLHLVIGVFAYFMAAIFKQGLVLQEEQDLTF